MNRFVRRSTIVVVALATTLGAGAALAANTGVSPELLKSALTSSHSTKTALVTAARYTSLSNAARLAGYSSSDQGAFTALKSASYSLDGGTTASNVRYSNDLRTALTTPGGANTSLGASDSTCESAPVKLADVGAAVRELASGSSFANEGSSSLSAPQGASPALARGGYKLESGNSSAAALPALAGINLALSQGGSSNTSFSPAESDSLAALKGAVYTGDDVSSTVADRTSATQVSLALRQR